MPRTHKGEIPCSTGGATLGAASMEATLSGQKNWLEPFLSPVLQYNQSVICGNHCSTNTHYLTCLHKALTHHIQVELHFLVMLASLPAWNQISFDKQTRTHLVKTPHTLAKVKTLPTVDKESICR